MITGNMLLNDDVLLENQHTAALILQISVSVSLEASTIQWLLLLLSGELLSERCRTDDLAPNIPSLAFLHAVWTPQSSVAERHRLLFSVR